jgi:YD repeat-containing protein
VLRGAGERCPAWDDDCPVKPPIIVVLPGGGTTAALTGALTGFISGEVARTVYDANGRPVALIDGRGATTTFAYDGFGRAIVVTDPDGDQKRSGYDAMGNVVWMASYGQAGATGLRLLEVGATRPICPACAAAIEGAGARAVAPLKVLRGAAAPDASLRERLESLAARFDDEYFQLDEDGGQKQQALVCFSKARATSALVFALAADDTQLHEAIYESISALDEPAELVRLVEHALG